MKLNRCSCLFSGSWRSCDIRYGRSVPATDLAIYASVCQANCGLAAGLGPAANQGDSRGEPAKDLQHCICSV